jgi:hypothetical protein
LESLPCRLLRPLRSLAMTVVVGLLGWAGAPHEAGVNKARPYIQGFVVEGHGHRAPTILCHGLHGRVEDPPLRLDISFFIILIILNNLLFL